MTAVATVDGVLVLVGAAVLGLGLLSTVLKRVFLSVPLVALALGVLAGPQVLALLPLGPGSSERGVLEELARITLSISLVATGLQFSRRDLRENAVRGGALLAGAMLGMWLMTSLGAWLLLDVEPWVALLIGGILTPTDPVVASSLVTGPLAQANLPRWLRRSLQLEAGANDGLGLIFVLVPALVLTADAGGAGSIAGEAGKQVAIALVAGPVLGVGAALLIDLAEEHRTMSGGWLLVSAVALALGTLGAVHALGGTGVLGSFLAGVAFSLTLADRYAEELEQMQTALEHLVIVPVFLLLGAILPWDDWAALGWPGVALAVWALVVRRPPVAALVLAPTRTPARGVAFLSAYGPIGVAAAYYAVFIERYELPEFERIYAACTLVIAVSVVAFSLGATPGVRAYGGRSPWTTLRHPLRPDVDGAP